MIPFTKESTKDVEPVKPKVGMRFWAHVITKVMPKMLGLGHNPRYWAHKRFS